jgi:aspartate/tyrosine/aromatic aminotransferase
MGFFGHVGLAPPDSILGLTDAFQKDKRKNKINLGVGLYKSERLNTPVLASVKMAEKKLLDDEETKEYLSIEGDTQYLEHMGMLVFGKEKWIQEKNRIASFQTVGGTGALKMGGVFLKEELPNPVWISNPTWLNHRGIFLSCGLPVQYYPYYRTDHQLDFQQMLACFEEVPDRSIIILHASCHNPTGCDLSLNQWVQLGDLFQRKKLVPFFDLAYQGLGRSLDDDAEAIRYFLCQGIEMLIAVSNAKNFALYGERAGCLFIVSQSQSIAEHILSRVKQVIRTTYSNPPMHGAKIVAQILSVPSLRKAWEQELQEMRERIIQTREGLFQSLAEQGKVHEFEHLTRGRGMFCFTGLKKEQVERMISDHGIYMTMDGRINVCGLNQSNMNDFVQALVSVMN